MTMGKNTKKTKTSVQNFCHVNNKSSRKTVVIQRKEGS